MPAEDDDVAPGFALTRIRLFKNGDAFTPARKMVISPRIYRNFEQLLHNLSQDFNLVNGAVRKIYNLEGQVITSFDQFEDDGAYVAAGMESFKKVLYMIRLAPKERGLQSVDSLPADGPKPTKRPKRIGKPPDSDARRAREGKPIIPEKQLFGPTSKAYRINVFTNGESGLPPVKVILNYRNCKSLDQVLVLVSTSLQRRITRLYDLESDKRILELQGLTDGMNVVATSGEGMKKANYPIREAINQTDLKRDDDLSQVLTFFPNGDAYSHGITMTVRRSRFATLKKLVEQLNASIHLLTGRIHYIYTLDGHRIESLEELLDRTQLDARLSAADASHEPMAAVSPEPVPNHIPEQKRRSRRKCFVVVPKDDSFLDVQYDVNRIQYRPVAADVGATKRTVLPKKKTQQREAREVSEGQGGLRDRRSVTADGNADRAMILHGTKDEPEAPAQRRQTPVPKAEPPRPSRIPQRSVIHEIEEEELAADGARGEESYEEELKHFNGTDSGNPSMHQ
ncbi:hypothetical protein DFJ73DRAFT_846952 [Zopfochytrium polystomum]|nr:hypothetical protein DFJ73DRAFT_846952 [Zopfochytrium polystomum]